MFSYIWLLWLKTRERPIFPPGHAWLRKQGITTDDFPSWEEIGRHWEKG